MTSKQEIKDSFITELKNTPEYQIILLVKQFILDEIAIPNVQQIIIYNFETPQTKEQQGIINMCFKLEFGFPLEYNINENCITIEMHNFID